MTAPPIRVLCIDDHALVREGIAALINRQPDMQVIAEASSGADGVEQFRSHQPDVALVDLRLPDISGIEVIARILGDAPNARLVVVSSFEGDVDILRALTAGAMGYLLKGMPIEGLLNAVREVHRGGKAIPPEVAAAVAKHLTDEPLTLREIEVLIVVATGARNRQIAGTLGISEDTVKMHVKNITAKLGAADRTEAVTTALKRGVIHL
ncbi:MAG: two component transcriptional regulator, LuxR family [Acidobacteria bacterium]|nr:two component transcriptional regulator, LuxR family [Acidobacteriota bacterium]